MSASAKGGGGAMVIRSNIIRTVGGIEREDFGCGDGGLLTINCEYVTLISCVGCLLVLL